MSDVLEREPKMSPQVSPKDIPGEGQTSESEEEEPAAIILEGSTSSDEDGDNFYNDDDNDDEGFTQGYVPLSQDEAELQLQNQTLTESEEETPEVQSSHVIGCSEGSSVTGIVPLSPFNRDVKMEQGHVDLIRQVMSRITLPSSAVPDWAKNVPEERWKASLVTSISNRTQTSPDSSSKK